MRGLPYVHAMPYLTNSKIVKHVQGMINNTFHYLGKNKSGKNVTAVRSLNRAIRDLIAKEILGDANALPDDSLHGDMMVKEAIAFTCFEAAQEMYDFSDYKQLEKVFNFYHPILGLYEEIEGLSSSYIDLIVEIVTIYSQATIPLEQTNMSYLTRQINNVSLMSVLDEYALSGELDFEKTIQSDKNAIMLEHIKQQQYLYAERQRATREKANIFESTINQFLQGNIPATPVPKTKYGEPRRSTNKFTILPKK